MEENSRGGRQEALNQHGGGEAVREEEEPPREQEDGEGEADTDDGAYAHSVVERVDGGDEIAVLQAGAEDPQYLG